MHEVGGSIPPNSTSKSRGNPVKSRVSAAFYVVGQIAINGTIYLKSRENV